ncbi:XRE family transcriptional regulator [Acetivibrio thermocellus BC1]|nr:XRE family transcriptional regulator [Acetivibrio thermocellus BC1]
MSSLGKRIKELREEKGLSQIELAKLLNISNTTLSQYETNQRVPSDEIKIKLAEFFNCSVDYLLGRTDIRNPYIPEEYTQKHKVTKRDLMQYEDFIKQAGIFFMNDEVAEEDKEKLFRDISELFWKAKEMNKKKYGRKKKAKTE